MKKSIALIGSIALATIPLISMAQTQNNLSTKDISGTYNCSGNDTIIDHKPYTSVLAVTKTGKTYQFNSADKTETFLGTGIISDDGSTVSMAFKKSDNPNVAGVQVYKVGTDGSLKGNWTEIGKEDVVFETCKKK